MHRNAANALFLSLLASCLALAQTPAPTQRIRGDVVSVDGLSLQVKERSGEMLTIKLAENYVVTGVAKVGIEAITPNAFVGTATMPQSDGTQTALEVLVFPESGRGSNEGHYPWDLQPGSMMTNATVTRSARSERMRSMVLKLRLGGNWFDDKLGCEFASQLTYMGGTSPSLPIATRAAVRLPSGCGVAVRSTCAPGFNMARSPGSNVTMGALAGTMMTFSPSL